MSKIRVDEIEDTQGNPFDLGPSNVTTFTGTQTLVDALNSRIPCVSVVEFGAVGGDVNVDKPAIQEAVDYAAANNLAVFLEPSPSGQPYIIDRVLVPSRSIIFGTGRSSEVKLTPQDYGDTSSPNQVGCFITRQDPGGADSSDILFHNFAIDGSFGNPALNGTFNVNIEGLDIADSRRVYCDLLFIRNTDGDGIDFDRCTDCHATRIHGDNCGAYLIHFSSGTVRSTASNCVAVGCGFEHSRGGFDVSGSSSRCRYSNITAINCFQGAVIDGNRSSITGAYFAGSVARGLRVTGTNNKFSNIEIDGVDDFNGVVVDTGSNLGSYSNVSANLTGDRGFLVRGQWNTFTGCIAQNAEGNGWDLTSASDRNSLSSCVAWSIIGSDFVDSGTGNSVSNSPTLRSDKSPTIETGTWTPTLVGASVTGSHTYTTQVGDYVRNGDTVFVSFAIEIDSFDSNAEGRCDIEGLPFSFERGFAYSGTISIFREVAGLPSDFANIFIASRTGTTANLKYNRDRSSGQIEASINIETIGQNGLRIEGNMTYQTS